MTWYYERDVANNRIRLRYVDDGGTIHGPRDVDWPDAPRLETRVDGWVVNPTIQEEAGNAVTDLYTSAGVETALMALRDLAAGAVEMGTPP